MSPSVPTSLHHVALIEALTVQSIHPLVLVNPNSFVPLTHSLDCNLHHYRHDSYCC